MGSEWRQYTLWDLAEYINGRATKPSEVCREGVPVIKIAELNRGITDETDCIPHHLVEDKHWVKPGDLLFAWSGSVGIYKYNGAPAALNQHIFRVIAKPYVDQGFLRYLLLSHLPTFLRHVEDKKTTMGHVTIRDIQRITVRVPPLPEQRAIAHILGTLDDKIELNRRMSQTLEEMARALFKAWFVDFEPVRAKMQGRWQRGQSLPGLPAHLYDLFPDRLVDSELGEIPEGWEVAKVGDEVEIIKGVSYRSEELENSDVALVTLKSFNRGGGYRADGLKPYIGPYKTEQQLYPGDLIVAQTDVTQAADVIGKPALVLPDHRFRALVASLDVLIIRPSASYLPQEFFYLLFLSPDFQEHIYGHTNGTTVLHLSRQGVPSFDFIKPPEPIARAFSKIVVLLFRQIASMAIESCTLVALLDALLPKLICGEIRVKDAEKFLKERGL